MRLMGVKLEVDLSHVYAVPQPLTLFTHTYTQRLEPYVASGINGATTNDAYDKHV